LYALLLVPILVSGYIMVIANLYHFYQLHKYDGQLLYLKVAAFGSFSVMFVVLSAALIKYHFPDFHVIDDVAKTFRIKKIVDDNKAGVWLILISFLSVFASLVWVSLVWLKNLFLGFMYEKNTHEKVSHAVKLRVLRKTVSAGSLDMMLLDAIESDPKQSVLITLQSRKVYVGIVNGILEPTEDEGANSSLSIFPIMSGYRNKNDLSVDFTNVYPGKITTDSAATTNSLKVVQLTGQMDIIFSAEEISHISWFDFDIYEQVNNSLKPIEPMQTIDLTSKPNELEED